MLSSYGLVGSFAALCLVLPASQAQTAALPPTSTAPTAAEPAMQLPADQKAYKATRFISDPEERTKALETFLHDFPDSKRADPAREILLMLLLEQVPQNVTLIHELAQTLIAHASPDDRANEANGVAYELAEAPPNGVALKSAETWVRDAVNKTTLDAFVASVKKLSAQYNMPVPPQADMQKYWAHARAAYLQTLGDVYLREGKLGKASRVLQQALALDPADGSIYGVQGEIAHARHQDGDALEDLERAAVGGGITHAEQTLLGQLYAAQHPQDTSGLEAEIDRRYKALAKPFTPTPHIGAPAGHTVLVELYTGSGCQPCVAADYGVDGLLEAYPRSEVVALSFDQHIPLPDPLSNPDTVARADYNGVSGTPSVKVDGRSVDGVYGTWSKAQHSFEAMKPIIDQELATKPGVALQLTARLDGAHSIFTSADVEVTQSAGLAKFLASPLEPTKIGGANTQVQGSSASTAPAEQASKLVLNFALVQQTVRYSGENGVRFHRMVVRALAKPSTEGFPIGVTGSSTASFTFDSAAISQALGTYLTAFEHHNEKFGIAHFLMKDTSLPLNQLAVAAWVEDPKTHHVVAAAFVPLQPQAQPQTQAAAR